MTRVTPEVTRASKDRFLKAYAQCGVIAHAAKAAGITSRVVYKWEKADPEFRLAKDDAFAEHADTLEATMFTLISVQLEKLDYRSNPALLIFALKGAKPEKYGDATAPTNDAKDMIVEFKQAMREANSEAKPQSPSTPSVVEEADRILESKSGGLDGSDNSE